MRVVAMLVLAMLVAAGAVQAQTSREPEVGRVETDVQLAYYDVAGTTAQALTVSLYERSPSEGGQRFFGLTEWEVNTEYRWVERATGCSMEDVRVRMVVRTHLPRWRDRGRADRPTRLAWERFERSLGAHEAEHRARILKAAEAMRWRLVSLREPTCRTMKLEAQRALQAEIEACKVSNDVYDLETGHGRTEGVAWPPEALGTR